MFTAFLNHFFKDDRGVSSYSILFCDPRSSFKRSDWNADLSLIGWPARLFTLSERHPSNDSEIKSLTRRKSSRGRVAAQGTYWTQSWLSKNWSLITASFLWIHTLSGRGERVAEWRSKTSPFIRLFSHCSFFLYLGMAHGFLLSLSPSTK